MVKSFSVAAQWVVARYNYTEAKRQAVRLIDTAPVIINSVTWALAGDRSSLSKDGRKLVAGNLKSIGKYRKEHKAFHKQLSELINQPRETGNIALLNAQTRLIEETHQRTLECQVRLERNSILLLRHLTSYADRPENAAHQHGPIFPFTKRTGFLSFSI